MPKRKSKPAFAWGITAVRNVRFIRVEIRPKGAKKR